MCVESANAPHSKIDLVVDRIENISNVAKNIATAAEEKSAVSTQIKIHLDDISNTTEKTSLETGNVALQMQLLTKSVEDISDLANTYIPQSNG